MVTCMTFYLRHDMQISMSAQVSLASMGQHAQIKPTASRVVAPQGSRVTGVK